MQFGLNNPRAMYQQAMTIILKEALKDIANDKLMIGNQIKPKERSLATLQAPIKQATQAPNETETVKCVMHHLR